MAEELIKVLNLDKMEYYETHLSIVNSILPKKMTPMQMKVLAGFMSLEGDIAKYRFGKTGRKLVMEQCKITAAGLSNYLKDMKEAGFLKEAGDMIEIWPILIPEANQQVYRLKLINKDYASNNIPS